MQSILEIRYLQKLLVLALFLSISYANAAIYVYDDSNTVSSSSTLVQLAQFSNVDLMYSRDVQNIEGNLIVAEFVSENSTTTDNCLLKPIPIGTTIVAIPFDQSMKSGCKNYADVISRNLWMKSNVLNTSELSNNSTIPPPTATGQQPIPVSSSSLSIFPSTTYSNPTLPAFYLNQKHEYHRRDGNEPTTSANNITIPQLVIFSSTNGGDPGVKELKIGNPSVLKNAAPYLTLISVQDMNSLVSLTNQSLFVQFTPEIGAYRQFISSKLWLRWSIACDILYGILFLASIYSLVRFCQRSEFFPRNPNTWILPGIAYSSLASMFILEFDPYNIRQDLLPISAQSCITNSVFLILGLCYVVLLFSWIKAANEKMHPDNRAARFLIDLATSKAHRLIYLNGFLLLAVFILNVILSTSPPDTDSTVSTLSFVLIIFVLVVINMTYLAFSGFMLEPLFEIRTSHKWKSLNRLIPLQLIDPADKEEITDILMMTASITCSFTLISIVNLENSRLPPTFWNFIKLQAIGDLSNIFSMLTLLLVLCNQSLAPHFPIQRSRGNLIPILNISDEPPTPEQIAEDEHRNSAAYTTRVPVVRSPAPAFTLNVIRTKSIRKSNIGGATVQLNVDIQRDLEMLSGCNLNGLELVNGKVHIVGNSFNDISLE